MLRKALLLIVVGAVGLTAFAATSLAVGGPGRPGLPTNLPAARLPVANLSEQASVEINNLIGAEQVRRWGITPDSYRSARRLPQTSAGAAYLIPGTDGACIVVGLLASGCGDPRAGRVMAVVASQSPSDPFVGVGVTTDAVQEVVVGLTGAEGKVVAVHGGVFTVSVPRPADLATGPTVEITEG